MNPAISTPPEDASREISALIESLHATEQRLHELTAGEVDTVADRDGRTWMLRRAQDRSRQSEAAKQAAILNALPAHIALLDAQGVIVSVNEAWRRFVRANGMRGADCGVGVNYLEVCDGAMGQEPSALRTIAGGIRSVLFGSEATFTIEYPCDSPTGKRSFLLTVTPLVKQGLGGAVVTHLDITEQKRAEYALRESEERFRATFEQAAVGMAHIAPDGRYLRVNDKLCEIMGYPRDELLRLKTTDVNVPEDRVAAHQAREAMLAGEQSVFLAEKRFVAKSGNVFWARVVSTALRDAAGVPKYLITVVEDITPRKLADFRLERLNRLYSVLRKVGEAIVHGRDARLLYDAVCRIMVEDGLLHMALVSHVDPATHRLETTASFGATGDSLASLTDTAEDGLLRRGTIGTAILTGNHAVCNDVAHDSRMAPWRDAAIRNKLLSVASFPLKVGRVTVGTLTLCANETGYFQADDIGLMDAVADDLSFAIDSLQGEQRNRIAEEELRRSQLKLSNAVRMAGLGSWDHDIIADRLEWSDQTLKIFGVDRESFGGNLAAFLALVHPDDREGLLKDEYDAKTGGGPNELEYRIVRPDGEARILYDRGALTFGEDGNPLRATGMVMDITERKNAEHALRRSDERFRRVFNQQFQFMAILSLEGQVLEVNDLPLRVGGVTREAVLGLPFWDTAWMKDLPDAHAWWATALDRASGMDASLLTEGQFRTGNGEVRDAEIAVTAVRGTDGSAEYFIVQGADITMRKRSEDLARARAALLRTAGQTSRLGGWVIDLPDVRVTWSDEVCAILEVPIGTVPTLEEAINYYTPEWRESISGAVSACIADGTSFDLELEILTSTGRRAWVRAVGEAERGPSEAIVRVQGAFQDISEHKRAEAEMRGRQEAEQANRAKSAFLANMSHEIRTPMNGVIGMIDVLYQTNLERDQVEMVDLMRDSAFSLLEIIDDILDFSKIEAGRLQLEQRPMSVADVVEKVCEMAYPMAQKCGVGLSYFTDPTIPWTALGDAMRLRQVLVNLVNNAVKFSGGRSQRGRVSVRAVLVEQSLDRAIVEFRVADNGIGMAPEALSRLFTSFTQADASTTRRFGGTGLGLAISGHLVEAMGGSIAVHSEPDVGSTFTVRMPFVANAEDGARPADPLVDGLHCMVIAGTGALVDASDDGLFEDVTTYLSQAGASVDHAVTLTDAAARSIAGAAGRSIWLVSDTDNSISAGDLRAFAQARPDIDVRFVVLGSGSRRRPRIATEGVVSIDGSALSRRALLAAVAIAAGRAEAPPSQPSKADVAVGLPPPIQRDVATGFILVAEDNATNQRVILRQLKLLGYAAHVARTGAEALELWRRGTYSMLLTDLQMPELDGYDLTRLIRTEENDTTHIPIIALTANAVQDEEKRCLAAGMDAYLTKPVRLASLQEMLERWMPSAAARPAPDAAATPDHATSAVATTVAESVDVAPAVDVSVLVALVGEDPDMLREFFEDFRDSAAKAAAEIQEAFANARVAEAQSVAHRLKSSARAVGALPLGELCAAIEHAVQSGSVAALPDLHTRFATEMVAVTRSLDSLCSRP
jgi:PAS domain S-box-containing protein